MKKSTLLSAMTVVAYCFCAAIAIIWISIIMAFALGYYTPKTVYAEDLYIDDVNENENIEIINGYPVLRINGIYESDNPNIAVDSTFVVRGSTTPITDEDGNVIDENPVTETKIYLTSSDPSVATVQSEGNIGEPIQINVTKDDNGVNRGGFCYINVQNDEGLYMSRPLVVFVDIPVTDLAITSSDMSTVVENEVSKFMLYEDEVGHISTQFLPTNSQDPSHIDQKSEFNNFRRNPKVVEYYLDATSPSNVISISQTGEIVAQNPGEVTVYARCLRTYDDIDFINNYQSGIPEWDDIGYIPPELLQGRYITKSFVIKVEEITLDAIDVDNRSIELPLFQTTSFTAEELGITMSASNGNDEYFANLLNQIVLTTDSKGLIISKNYDTNEWEFTVEQEPMQGLVVYVTLASYPNVSAELNNFLILRNDIESLEFEGTSKTNPNMSHNDLVEMSITKNGDIITSVNNTWDWTENVEIVSTDGGNQPSYFLVKVFAKGTYHNNSQYSEGRYTNEQGEEIIQLGSTYFSGFGREVRGLNLRDPSVVQALARGNILLRAYVVKTDMHGNPIDQNGDVMRFDSSGNVLDENGDVITTNVPTFVAIASSDEVTFRVTEQMTNLETYINIESTGQTELIGSTQNGTNSKILAVSSVSRHQISLFANSSGALFDAFNNSSESGTWLRVVNNDTDTVSATLEEQDLGNNAQNYYLNLDVHTYNISEYISRDIRIEYYTGNFNVSSDGYETVFTLHLYIIEVPIESISLNVNTAPTDTVNDIDYYEIAGQLNYTYEMQNGVNEVTGITSNWGTVSTSGVLTEILLLQPTFEAGTVQVLQDLVEGEDYLLPTALTISNTSYNYSVVDAQGARSNVASVISATVDNQNVYRIQIHELDQEAYIVLTATYQNATNPITDRICIKGNLTSVASNSIQWKANDDGEYSTTASVDSLNIDAQGGGYNLRENSLFSLVFRNASSTGTDINVSNTSTFLSYEVASESANQVRLTESNGVQVLTFSGQPLDTVEAHINVVLTTSDGLNIRQQYIINFN